MDGNLDLVRYKELSEKLYNLGITLGDEGEKKEDFIIGTTGNLLVFIAGLLYDEDDLYFISEMLTMFSAKKILQSELNEEITLDDIKKIIKKKKK
jgi:hypothetical protein